MISLTITVPCEILPGRCCRRCNAPASNAEIPAIDAATAASPPSRWTCLAYFSVWRLSLPLGKIWVRQLGLFFPIEQTAPVTTNQFWCTHWPQHFLVMARMISGSDIIPHIIRRSMGIFMNDYFPVSTLYVRYVRGLKEAKLSDSFQTTMDTVVLAISDLMRPGFTPA